VKPTGSRSRNSDARGSSTLIVAHAGGTKQKNQEDGQNGGCTVLLTGNTTLRTSVYRTTSQGKSGRRT